MPIDLELYKAIETIVESKTKDIKVEREEFNLLVVEVRKLAQAQNEFAQAQKESEKRLTRVEIAIEELVKTQNEFAKAQNELAQAQNELAQAQKESEKRLTRVERVIEELGEAQKRTEKELQSLIKEHKKTREEVGSLSHTVGFRLEDESFKALPHLLKRDMGIEIVGRLKRDYIEIRKNQYIEVNIFGKGRLDGKEYLIVGEAKSQLKRGDVDNFVKHTEKIKEYITQDQIKLLVTYQTSPNVQRYVKERGINLYFSYEF
ncbi:TPA: chordopoxvirus fusion protein [bacterium]|nr:chordopoxvirus fusion protein [bacterium]